MDGINVDIVKLVCYWGQRLTMLLMLAMMPMGLLFMKAMWLTLSKCIWLILHKILLFMKPWLNCWDLFFLLIKCSLFLQCILSTYRSKTFQCKYMYERKMLIALGGVIFARPMRDRQYLTMLDPIQEKSGAIVVVLVYFATLCGDVFWTASILVALGKLYSTILLYQFMNSKLM